MVPLRPFAALALSLTTLAGAVPLYAEPQDFGAADPVLAAEQICPQAILDLTEEAPGQLGVMLFSPCHAGQGVVLDHAGLTLRLPVSDLGAVYASLPVLNAAEPVSVTFENGRMAEAMPPAALARIEQAAARW